MGLDCEKISSGFCKIVDDLEYSLLEKREGGLDKFLLIESGRKDEDYSWLAYDLLAFLFLESRIIV